MPTDVPLRRNPATEPGIDPVLAGEQAYLAAARAELARMREQTLALDAHGGNAVSEEYLKASLHRRVAALTDDPETPLFFGRLDLSTAPPERFYIGRRHVHDDAGDPVVIDWRADISRAFYQATRADPMDVALRRRFGFERGHITAYEDEHLVDRTEAERRSAILTSEIERPRVGPMRDIVATIQPEQDVIVRAGYDETVCVQGAPGTGKTAVGLHRAAYLLYAHRDRLRRGGVLVVGPNRAFLSYIAQVLPALGEVDVRQVTLDELVARVPVRADEDASVATLKGDARMAEVLRRAVYAGLGPVEEALVVPRGSRRWRVPVSELAEIVTELQNRDVRYGAGRAMLAQRLAHAVLTKMEAAGESPDDRVQDAMARAVPVRAMVDRLWPKVEPAKVVLRLLSDPATLAAAADGVLTDDEQTLLLWPTPPRGPRSARWSLADAVLVDEAADLVDREPSLGHVVLDEAQDLSPMMLRSVGRQCSTGSATILGDLAQATTPWAVSAWDEALAHLGKQDAHLEELTLGFRVPGDVIDYAAGLLPTIAPTLSKPTSVRRARGELDIRPSIDLVADAIAAVKGLHDQEGSIGLIVPDALGDQANAALTAAGVDHSVLGRDDDIEARVDVVPASLAKGLEFDHVVLVEPADIAGAEADERTGLRRLYVCLTRAVTSLVVLHSKPIPRGDSAA
jgi:DNA helicase IV